jgi:hypothetical protein
MKLTNLVIALATFATVTLSSAFYVSQQEVTSAVIVDKAKHSLDLTTNGLYHISLSEAFTIDKSEAAQINFLRCSFARPEFRFSWYCHQMKIDGKMTKNSYVALKDDQQKAYQKDLVRSLVLGGYEMMKAALQLHRINSPVGSGVPHSQKKVSASDLDLIIKEPEAKNSKASDVNGEARAVDGVEKGGSELKEFSLYEMTRGILKSGKIVNGIVYFDKPEDKYLLNKIDQLKGAKPIGEIYKEIQLENFSKIYLDKSEHPHGFVGAVLNFFITDNIQLSKQIFENTVEYHYNRKDSTISYTYKYERLFLTVIALILLLEIAFWFYTNRNKKISLNRIIDVKGYSNEK